MVTVMKCGDDKWNVWIYVDFLHYVGHLFYFDWFVGVIFDDLDWIYTCGVG